MQYIIFDLEADALLDGITKIHCLSYSIYDDKEKKESKTLTNYKDIKEFFDIVSYYINGELYEKEREKLYFIGHNIIGYDIPAVEKILNIKINQDKLLDTLGISWYLYPLGGKFKHGLEHWGERLGFGKPRVEDWKNQPLEVYIKRCEADVEINTRLFHHQMGFLHDIYEDDEQVLRTLKYFCFKQQCLRDHEITGLTLNKRLAEKSKLDLEFIIDEKASQLSKMMPKDLGKVIRTKPKVPYKQDGSLSHYGEKWFTALKELGLPEDAIEIKDEPNPGSHTQLKEWLFRLGWKPETFKVNDKDEKIPQVSLPFGAGLCPSVLKLAEEHTYLEALKGLYKARHRKGLFNAFLETVDKHGKVYCRAHGFTNTHRLQHVRPIANLPKPKTYYGAEVRGCLTIPSNDYIMIGSDLSELEDKTKQHYIYKYDPEYVKEMQKPGFNAHIDIALQAELITEEEATFYKSFDKNSATEEESKKYEHIKERRHIAKNKVNFPCTYGAGAKKIAEGANLPISEGRRLFNTYWKRNRGVKQTANACKIKTVRKQKWLYNPVSGFWMFLKADKDRFSTLNQSTGVYVFDNWVSKVRKRLTPLGIYISLQYHDKNCCD